MTRARPPGPGRLAGLRTSVGALLRRWEQSPPPSGRPGSFRRLLGAAGPAVRLGSLPFPGEIARTVVEGPLSYDLPPVRCEVHDAAGLPALRVDVAAEVAVRLGHTLVQAPGLAVILRDGRVAADLTPDLERRTPAHRASAAVQLGLPRRLPGCLALLSSGFDHNYHHWLFDALARLPAVHATGCQPEAWITSASSPLQAATARAAGLPPFRILDPSRRWRVRPDELAAGTYPESDGVCRPSRVAFVRRLLLSLEDRSAPPADRVFITRPPGAPRRLTCEDELTARLASDGWVIARLEDLDVGTQVRLFTQARIVAGAHGAGLSNIACCLPGTLGVEIQPATDPRPHYRALARSAALDYRCIVAAGNPGSALDLDIHRTHAALSRLALKSPRNRP